MRTCRRRMLKLTSIQFSVFHYAPSAKRLDIRIHGLQLASVEIFIDKFFSEESPECDVRYRLY